MPWVTMGAWPGRVLTAVNDISIDIHSGETVGIA